MRTPPEALSEILARAAPLDEELVSLSDALGRVLSRPVRAGRSLPPWDNAAMDGYAVRAREVVPGVPLTVQGVVAAGQVGPPLAPGSALRIMTGAPLPEGADAVIMREEATEEGGRVRFVRSPRPGDHVRRRGEDVAEGSEVLAAGAEIGPGEVGLLAALGRTLVEVHRRPQVSILSTGDELVPADRPLGPGQIVGSNAHALCAQVVQAGGLPRMVPFLPDDPEALRVGFGAALQADVVLSSGGVSVGEFDHVKEVLVGLGVQQHFWQVAMKPGKPLSFGTRQGVLVFGLPGNPASSMVSFELFVRPALRRMLGLPPSAAVRPRVPVRLRTPLQPDRRRVHFVRARLERASDGVLWAQPAAQQGSGMLRSMVGIHALLEVPPGEARLEPETELIAHLLVMV
ncbi:MAG: molybdopterin molybdotransferase MoeA [Myxococcales bacterium]|nr:molybdopterin molybdotransferase MoeA [Myxococcota bacterium]MDW8281611.1 molybdopterin molybdotransferase MoeA [Myxococcales bacterium]